MKRRLATLAAVVPLAQLVDALPGWAWNALLAAGTLGPLVGLLISLATRTAASWKVTGVTIFYMLAVPLFIIVILGRSDGPIAGCAFLILMPVGIILGLAVLTPRARVAERRGFEVQPRPRETE